MRDVVLIMTTRSANPARSHELCALHLNVVEAKTCSSGTMLHVCTPRGWGRELG